MQPALDRENVLVDTLKALVNLPVPVRVGRAIAWALLSFGVASLAYAGLKGDLDVFLVVIVPVVTGTGGWAAVGMLATIAGLVALFWTSANREERFTRPPPGRGPRPPDAELEPERPSGDPNQEPSRGDDAAEEAQSRGGGVILIGPIPIAWGSDRSTLGWLVLAGILLSLAAIVLWQLPGLVR